MPYLHKLSNRLALIKDRAAVAATAALVAGAAVACERAAGTTGPAPTVSRLVVSPKSVVLPPKQALYFLAVGLMPAGDTGAVTVTWGATGGAMLDTSTASGVHYAHYQAAPAPGSYQVIAAEQPGGKADTAVVTVSSVSVASVTVSPATASLQVGQTVQLTGTPKDASGGVLSGRVVTWASSNPAAATVSPNGLVAGVAVGAATITATSEEQNGTSSVTVAVIPVAAVSVSPGSATVVAGNTVQLTATPKDASGGALSGRVVTWASSNPAAATVSGSGLVTGVAAGAATVTATSEGQSGTAAITVSSVAVASVTVSPATASLQGGQTAQLTATPKDASGAALTGRVVTWASSNPAAATVSGSGLVTGVAAGAATVTATSEGKSGTAAITVASVPVASVTVSPATASLQGGQTAQLTATPKDASGGALSGRVVTWASSNPAAATVSGSGLVTGVAAGAATVTATSEGKSGTAAITVASVPVASVTLTPAAASTWVGGTLQLAAIPKDAGGNLLSGRVVTWASSNPAVTTVSGSGLVTGVTAGSATITATSEGKSGTAAITVTTSTGGSVITDPNVLLTEATVAKAGYLLPIAPSPFGLKVTRVANDPGQAMTLQNGSGSWGSDARQHYSKDQPWSADGSLLALQNSGSPDYIYLDGNTYQPVRGKCSNYGYDDDRWHPTSAHAHERINASGSSLIWFDVTTCTETRRWSLPLSVVGLGMGEGNVSFDGRYVALSDGVSAFLVDMDPQAPFVPYPSSRIGPTVSLSNCGLSSGCSIDWVSVSPSGKYVIVVYNGDHLRVYAVDPATLAFTPLPMPTIYANCAGTAAQGFIYDVGHADMTLNPFDGNEDVIVGQEHCGNAGRTVSGLLIGGVMMVRLRDGAITPLTDPTNEAYPHHVSTRSYDRPGWAYVGYYYSAGQRFSNEIIAVKLDGSKSVERIAHSHTDDGCYRCEAHAVPSRDGLRVLFASDWMVAGAGTGSTSITQAFVVDTRP